MLTVFEQALVMHLIGDWLLQNHWMAENKPNLKHPAAWIHTGVHVVLLSLVLGIQAGVILGILHMIVDTRGPLIWWRRVFGMTTEGPFAQPVAIWSDQVLHIVCIAAWVHFVMPLMQGVS